MTEPIDFKKLRDDRDNEEENNAPKTFGEALFPSQMGKKLVEYQHSDMEMKTQEPLLSAKPEAVKAPIVVSEKKSILSSFEKFVSDNGEESDSGVEVHFEGGKVVNTDASQDKVFNLEELEMTNGDNVVFFDNYEKEKLKVIFICEKPKDMTDENRNQDLLSKMIGAMNIPEKDYVRVFIAKDEKPQESCAFVMKELIKNEAMTVVTMGAFATNAFTRKKDRLSKIHGKLSEFSFINKDITCAISHFPVFHPDLLTINPNMKRSAWIDLQKVMKHVGYS